MNDKSKSLIDSAAEIAESVLPEVQKVLASALNMSDEGATTGSDTAADAAPASSNDAVAPDSTNNRARGLLAVLVVGALIAIAGVVIQRILNARGGEDDDDNWTSSYTPTPPEAEADTTSEEAASATTDGDAPAEEDDDSA